MSESILWNELKDKTENDKEISNILSLQEENDSYSEEQLVNDDFIEKEDSLSKPKKKRRRRKKKKNKQINSSEEPDSEISVPEFEGFEEPDSGIDIPNFEGFEEPDSEISVPEFEGFEEPDSGIDVPNFESFEEPDSEISVPEFEGFEEPDSGIDVLNFESFEEPDSGIDVPNFESFEEPDSEISVPKFEGFEEPDSEISVPKFESFEEPDSGIDVPNFESFEEPDNEINVSEFEGFEEPDREINVFDSKGFNELDSKVNLNIEANLNKSSLFESAETIILNNSKLFKMQKPTSFKEKNNAPIFRDILAHIDRKIIPFEIKSKSIKAFTRYQGIPIAICLDSIFKNSFTLFGFIDNEIRIEISIKKHKGNNLDIPEIILEDAFLQNYQTTIPNPYDYNLANKILDSFVQDTLTKLSNFMNEGDLIYINRSGVFLKLKEVIASKELEKLISILLLLCENIKLYKNK